ncbi:hypothetical protein BDR04DRAFT_1105525 [Suillus decipiens]|nr:hypothetical protein BDR04DRAFT_1105525 [Suillus decipiens]
MSMSQRLDGVSSSMQLGEAKQDKQRNSGYAKPSKRHRIDITLPPPQLDHAQMYGYCISETNAQLNPSYSFKKNFHIRSLSTGCAILPSQQMVPAECIVDGAVLVLCIFKDWPHSYRRRPTQEQVDELTSFMGREPQWWVDALPRSFRM